MNKDWPAAQYTNDYEAHRSDPLKDGFATVYAATNLLEDRAETYAHLMVNEEAEKLMKRAEKDPVLDKKIKIIKKFLMEKCCYEMNEDYWKKIAAGYDFSAGDKKVSSLEKLKIFPDSVKMDPEKKTGADFKISNLPENCVLSIMDKTGAELLTLKESDFGNKGFIIWNGKGIDGSYLPAGNYSCVILDENKNKKTIKIVYSKSTIMFLN
ncbi:MAG: hypothetical protein A2231_06280 [Candidatus Firestonebacteria bacterium RIFOXYA2_FULL_40_8]|nr:MAG: hypothetical protein A2231_06280 [Candidatus Firestonebacteria bacterium RIFOXYA2_FULL_40_8]